MQLQIQCASHECLSGAEKAAGEKHGYNLQKPSDDTTTSFATTPHNAGTLSKKEGSREEPTAKVSEKLNSVDNEKSTE